MALEPKGRARFFTAEAGRQHLADWLFLETMEDLEQRARGPVVREAARYRYLGIAPLLRKLLIDQHTLIDSVRRNRTRPLPMYRASPFEPTTFPDRPDIVQIGLGHEKLFDPDAEPLPLKNFLKLRVGHAAGHDITTHDAIKHYAEVEGGVHFGKIKHPASDALQLFGPATPFFFPLLVSVMTQLAEITLDACVELREVVALDYEDRETNPKESDLENPAARLGMLLPGLGDHDAEKALTRPEG